MADEGDQMHMEHQSNAGKWILTVLAVVVVAVSGYAHYTTQKQVRALQDELGKARLRSKNCRIACRPRNPRRTLCVRKSA